MNLRRLALFAWIAACFTAAFTAVTPFTSVHAQETPEGHQDRQAAAAEGITGTMVVLFMRGPGPTIEIEDAASVMKPGDSDSVRAVVDSMFKVPGMYRMPDMMAAVVKQRIIDAQTAYLVGKSTGVTDSAVVDAINMLATTFQTPDYGMVSLLQVQFVRGRLASTMPMLFKPVNPDLKIGEPNVPMSPVQALFVMSVLIDQKIQNGGFQLSPTDWDRDVYPRAMEQERARQELRRRIESGDVQPRFELRGSLGIGTARLDLLRLLQQRILAMSVADGLKLFNETFARLGIP